MEPELCFRVSTPIDRALKRSELVDYIDGVAPALEIIDSRYENFKFSLEDVIADNCSSAAFVVGPWHSVDVDMSDLHIELIVNDESLAEGSSSAILGDPWLSVLAASRLCAQYNQLIPANAYLLAGAATPAIYLQQDQHIKVAIDSLGSAEFSTTCS